MNSDASDFPCNRWTLLAMGSIAFVINFLDRQVLSVLAPTIRRELSLSQTQYGVIVFSFLLGMALFQIPNGMLMDRAGPRKGFTIIVGENHRMQVVWDPPQADSV